MACLLRRVCDRDLLPFPGNEILSMAITHRSMARYIADLYRNVSRPRFTRFWIGVIMPFFICPIVPRIASAQSPTRQDPMPTYTHVIVNGFSVMIDDDSFRNCNQADITLFLRNLRKQLEKAVDALPSDRLSCLMKVKIWLTWDNSQLRPVTNNELPGLIFYVPSNKQYPGIPNWKSTGIEISTKYYLLEPWASYRNYFNPYWLLHELIHAYQDNYVGWDDKRVLDTYRTAMDQGLYQMGRVTYADGSFDVGMRPTHARRDQNEFFAELSVAYLAVNWISPRTRQALEKYDSRGYELMKDVWEGGYPSTARHSIKDLCVQLAKWQVQSHHR